MPQDLQKKIRYLATIRNKLVHERGFNHIPVSHSACWLAVHPPAGKIDNIACLGLACMPVPSSGLVQCWLEQTCMHECGFKGACSWPAMHGTVGAPQPTHCLLPCAPKHAHGRFTQSSLKAVQRQLLTDCSQLSRLSEPYARRTAAGSSRAT